MYLKHLNFKKFYFKKEKKDEFNTYHTFVIQAQKRDQLKKYFTDANRNCFHYPVTNTSLESIKNFRYKKTDFPITENQAKLIFTLFN